MVFSSTRRFLFAPRVCREGAGGTGGAGAALALARSARRATDARVLQTLPAHRRAAARAMMRARAHRVPRARRPKKTAGPKRVCAPNDVGTVGDRGISIGVFFPVSSGAMPPERKRDVEGVPSCAWVTTADPRRRSRPCRSSRGRGRIETSVEESRMWETAFQSPSRSLFVLFSSRVEKSGRGGARRASNPRARDARRASDADFDWPRELS